jgi:L-threonylcarbamoyladenylate synthase
MSGGMTRPSPISDPTPAAIAKAARLLREGKLVAFPTETVYGLGADATDDAAVTSIFAAKGRPQFNPLIVHVDGFDAAVRYGVFDTRARALAARFWPGALTLVVPRAKDCGVSWLATAGLETIALRVPAHAMAQNILAAFGGPVAAPSANRSGFVSSTSAQHVAESFGDAVELIIDGGRTVLGLESTIVGLTEAQPTLLRPGAIAREDIEAVVGPLGVAHDHADAPHSPGRLKRHYATVTPLRLNASSVEADEVLLAFGSAVGGAGRTLNLSPSGDLREAAANLFAMLRALDACGARGIAVMPVPKTGLGEAINDRLQRAAVRA